MVVYIGDVHGKFPMYYNIISNHKNTVQVGDFGLGFLGHEKKEERALNFIREAEGTHRFIRGNHDNPWYVKTLNNYIPDGTIENGVMYVGGEFSVDWSLRRVEVNWWADEELTYPEFDALINLYKKEKPRRMVTHGAPSSISQMLWERVRLPSQPAFPIVSRTQQALQSMFEIHPPKEWVFGHWHTSFDEEVWGTRFICLPELETIELDD